MKRHFHYTAAVATAVIASSFMMAATPDATGEKNSQANVIAVQKGTNPEVEITGTFGIESQGKTIKYTGAIELTIHGVVIKSKGNDAWLEIQPNGSIHLSPHGWITTIKQSKKSKP